MARVLVLSSLVACGHVGLSAGQPVLQALGHAVTGLPTVVLSNHPGFGAVSGQQVPVAQLAGMLDALEANGWLAEHDAVLTGYLPSAAHVAFAAELIGRMRAGRGESGGEPRVVVDPVLGDAPGGLYIHRDAAEAVRDVLVPLADVITPNAFELGWLTGRPRAALAGPDGIAAARALADRVIVTSADRNRNGQQTTGVLDLTAAGATYHPVDRLDAVPHGVGDVFAALMAAGLPVPRALGHLQALIAASQGAPHLRIAETLQIWTRADPLEEPTDGL